MRRVRKWKSCNEQVRECVPEGGMMAPVHANVQVKAKGSGSERVEVGTQGTGENMEDGNEDRPPDSLRSWPGLDRSPP
eukprot:6490401-Amphidinium_carterae.4